MVAKTHSGGQSGVVIEGLERFPLLAEVDADVRSGHSQVSAALVKAEILDFIAFLQLDCLEVLQLAQIPQLDAGVLGGRGQIVAVFRKR